METIYPEIVMWSIRIWIDYPPHTKLSRSMISRMAWMAGCMWSPPFYRG